MTNEAPPTLYPEIREVEAPPGRGMHGYYRKPDGWIVVAMTTPANRSSYEYKGHVFLKEYGEFSLGTTGGAPKETDMRGVPWNPADESFRLIFQQGGAHEFAISQIIEYGWHLKPPYREVEFPQLEGVDITDIPCPECGRILSGTEKAKVVQDLRTHLTSEINRPHSYSATDLRELGKEWDVDFDSVRSRNVERFVREDEDEDEGESLVATVPADEPERDKEHVCSWTDCGWAPQAGHPNPAKAVTGHEISHKRAARAAEASSLPVHPEGAPRGEEVPA